jgi:hypothetical protein
MQLRSGLEMPGKSSIQLSLMLFEQTRSVGIEGLAVRSSPN